MIFPMATDRCPIQIHCYSGYPMQFASAMPSLLRLVRLRTMTRQAGHLGEAYLSESVRNDTQSLALVSCGFA